MVSEVYSNISNSESRVLIASHSPCTSKMSGNTSFYLLELPAELRCLIWGYLFQDSRIMFSKPIKSGLLTLSEEPKWLVVRHNTNVSVLATCRSLRREAAPIFWNKFEMFIPSQLLYDFRETGLWSHPILHKMTSLRPQVQNISIGARIYGRPEDDSVATLSMITCFVADLKYYSNLKRLTLTSVNNGRILQYSHPVLQGEENYESLSDAERHKAWEYVKSIQRVFCHSSHRKIYPCWIHFWRPVYDLIMNWRSDPIRANMFGDVANNDCGKRKSELPPGMNFTIYHQNYEQIRFEPKNPTQSAIIGTCASPYGYGEMPPLVYEAEVVAGVYDHLLVPRNIQLVGEHRAFWQQSDPPKQLSDIRDLPSLLISYPFWIS